MTCLQEFTFALSSERNLLNIPLLQLWLWGSHSLTSALLVIHLFCCLSAFNLFKPLLSNASQKLRDLHPPLPPNVILSFHANVVDDFPKHSAGKSSCGLTSHFVKQNCNMSLSAHTWAYGDIFVVNNFLGLHKELGKNYAERNFLLFLIFGTKSKAPWSCLVFYKWL